MTEKYTGHLFLIICILFLSSCDRVANIHIQIINSFSKSIIVTYMNKQNTTDTMQTVGINPGDTAIIFKTLSGILGRNEIPRDVHLLADTFNLITKLEIAVDTVVLKKNFCLSKEWTYSPISKDLGVYSLSVDSADIYQD